MFCQNCGSKNDDNVKFCFNCGSLIQNLSSENDKVLKEFKRILDKNLK